MKIYLPVFFLLINGISSPAQNFYTDFIGAGHNEGIIIQSSSSKDNDHQARKTLDGFPLSNQTQLHSASRFLSQASLGADYETIQMAAAMGFEAWMDEQFNLPQHNTLTAFETIFRSDLFKQILEEEEERGEDIPITNFFFRSAWWQSLMQSPDILRKRLSLALSEIFVVSDRPEILGESGYALMSYYDLLEKNAFANYKTLLTDVTYHPVMGIYLSHFNNPKADTARNIHPDENYAREIMQLFSIGLYELNPDGTCKTDSLGNCIESYNNDVIREFAKVFTGLGAGAGEEIFGIPPDQDALNQPMKMYPEYHEPGEKRLLNGMTLPDGQSGDQDIAMAMDNLSNHPNVGPFLGKSLIQFLVTSNPSPDYVARVSAAYEGGANGRGDFQNLIKAILLDPEARDCDPLSKPNLGKLREPLHRYIQLSRSFNLRALNKIFLFAGYRFSDATQQMVLNSPSVFNFFLPDYQPNGDISNANLVAPEFQIHNSSTAIGFLNESANLIEENNYTPLFDDNGGISSIDYRDELALASDPRQLVNRLNTILAAGQLSEMGQNTIVQAISQLDNPEQRVGLAIYLIMISPDYAVLK